MIVTEYKALFHKLDRHATSIIENKYDRVFFFVRRFMLLIYLVTPSLVGVGSSFVELSNHARVMDEKHYKGHASHDKRPSFQGRFCGSHHSSRPRDSIC